MFMAVNSWRKPFGIMVTALRYFGFAAGPAPSLSGFPQRHSFSSLGGLSCWFPLCLAAQRDTSALTTSLVGAFLFSRETAGALATPWSSRLRLFAFAVPRLTALGFAGARLHPSPSLEALGNA